MNPFSVTQPLPGVYHIRDAASVCFTLVVGERDTLLWDTGVGLYDVSECVAPYVRGKITVVLSHAHYDHACGQHYFDETYVYPEDLNRCRRCAGRANRSKVLKRIAERGLIGSDYPQERFLRGTPETVKPLETQALDLGNLEILFFHTPGHTAGSICAYVPHLRLLLTGDSWNPPTWLFFPESRPLSAYVRTLRNLYALEADTVLRPHDLQPASMEQLRAYIDGLNAQTFASAQPCPIPPYTRFSTYCCYPEPGSKLVFNNNKRG